MHFHLSFLFLSIQLLAIGQTQSPNFWNRIAKLELTRALTLPNWNYHGKNVMFFLGDGMGVSTLTPARIYKGEFTGKSGEQELLSFEKFDHAGLVKTYNTDYLVPDSAGTATAFCTGIKTRCGLIGVDDRVVRKNCSTFKEEAFQKSFVKYAMESGKSVGVITTTRITHATPAATYAYSADRDWESDRDVRSGGVPPSQMKNCPDIASQLISNGLDIQVILGGGRKNFMLENQTDPEVNSTGVRTDRDLIELWKNSQKAKKRRYQYVHNGDQLRNLKLSNVDYLLGLFSPSHMDYEIHRRENGRKQPSLSEMVESALSILTRNPKGFVLFAEGGRIDHGHHASIANYALHDTLALDEAVEKARTLVNLKDTLVMATADHSHVFTYGGYHQKGVPVLGKTTINFGDGPGLAKDDKPFTNLLYANGPGGPENTPREDITNVNTAEIAYRQQAAVPLYSETHGGEDVGVFAEGPMSHLIHGVHEQHYLAHVVMYSACLGPYRHEYTCPHDNFSMRFAPTTSLIAVLALVSVLLNFRVIK